MNPEPVLQALRAAVDRLEAVRAEPGKWGAELAGALEAFDSLDRWLSRGGALPATWTSCRHPAVRTQRAARPAVPGPRRPE